MKSKYAAALLIGALALAGCGNASAPSPEQSSNSASPASATLSEWSAATGITDHLRTVVDELSGLVADLKALPQGDTSGIGKAYGAHATKIVAQADAIDAIPASDDSQYETLRTTMTGTIRDFADKAQALAKTAGGSVAAELNAASASLPPMTAAIKAFSDYLAAHGKDVVHRQG